jgi:hypothetical protein
MSFLNLFSFRKIYFTVANVFMWSGAIAGLALVNLTDAETWKSVGKIAVGLAFFSLTMVLLPFLVIGVLMLMAGDKLYHVDIPG